MEASKKLNEQDYREENLKSKLKKFADDCGRYIMELHLEAPGPIPDDELEELFGKYDEGDLEKLCFLLGGELSLSIQMYNLHRYYYEEGMAKMKDTSRHKMMMEKEENRLHSLLDNSPDLLNQSYHWCLIYQKYCNRIVGEKGGYQYRKK